VSLPTEPLPIIAPPPGSSAGLGRSTALMASGTAVSRVLGVVRGTMLVWAISLNGNAANAFAAANKLPNFLFALVAGGVLNAVLVPQVVRAYQRANGQEYVDRLLTLGIALLLGLTAVLTVAAPLLIFAYSDFTDPAVTRLAILFAFWCIPQMFFYGLYSLLGQVLAARGSFGPYMWAPVVNNLISMVGLAVFVAVNGTDKGHDSTIGNPSWWGASQVTLLGGTFTLGVVVQAVILLVPLYRSGFRYRPRWGFRGAGLRSAGQVAYWTFLGLLVGQAGIVVMNRVTTASGGNNLYDNAFLIFMLPHSIVTVSLMTALFTRLSARAAAGDVDAVRADLSLGLRTVGLFTILATAVIAVLAYPLGRVLFFSATSTELADLTPVIVSMVAGLVAFGAWSLAQRVYYAYEDARSMFWIQVVMAAVTIVGTLLGQALLAPRYWAVAAGAAMSVSYVVGAGAALVAVGRRLRGMDGSRVVTLHVKGAVAAGIAAAAAALVVRLLGPVGGWADALLTCAIGGTVLTVAYVGLLTAMRVPELAVLVETATGRFSRRRTGGRSDDGRLAWGLGSQPGTSTAGGVVADVVGRGTVLAGRYRVLQPLESDLEGSPAWQATDQILDRPVRVRILVSGNIPQALDAARRAALVSDPRLVRVLDVGSHEGINYVVTEEVRGPSLAELLAAGPFTGDQARAVIGEVASALEVARRRGVHHLALRPSVVHITPDDRVLLTGLALDGALLGQGLGDARSTTRADTIGLVRLLYATLTGRWPVSAQDLIPSTGNGTLPAAPITGDAPVPPGDLVAGIPADLDTLCVVTLGSHDDGPHSPAELVRELEPWGEIRTVGVPGRPDQGPSEPTGAAAIAAVAPLAPARVDRQSVRATFQQAPVGPHLPGTPPPAHPGIGFPVASAGAAPGSVPPQIGRPDTTAPRHPSVGETAFLPVMPPPVMPPPGVHPAPAFPPGPPPSVPTARVGWDATTAAPSVGFGLPFDEALGSPEPLTERRFDPTKLMIAVVAVIVVIGVIIAFKQLVSPVAPRAPLAGPVPVASSTAPGQSSTPGARPSSSAGSTQAPGAAIAIASVSTIDPSSPTGEHPELAARAVDGDPATTWYTHTYKNANFGGIKPAVGFVLNFAAPSTVTSVTLHVNGQGGNVELRATDATSPTAGPVLASGPLSPDTVLTLSKPTKTSSIVLWFTSLAQAPDGSNRIEISEITVS
jgi:murein biosynthesis integral membrane protein MurJ